MRLALPLLALALTLGACRTDPDKDPDDTAENTVDADGDGYRSDVDCDDTDAAVHPGAEESCNEVDDDCDGEIDEGLTGTWYPDADADGWGDAAGAAESCGQPSGWVEDGTDCDDADPDTFPGAPERCDGLDNDCDGDIDEEVQDLWYADGDGDGYGNPDASLDSCDPGAGWVTDGRDCDDDDPAVFPGAEEVCNEVDDDCDGEVDEDLGTTWYADGDSDGWGVDGATIEACDPGAGWAAQGGDCDDANSGIHPDAEERCNGYDDDCDALIDDEDPDVVDAATWYVDGDGDGYGDDAATVLACEEPAGASRWGGDCDDSDPAYNPGATEDDCGDPNDYNCDGSVGYADNDGDGYAACEECDDGDAAIFPGATEVCDGVDDDCDGEVDEADAADAATWYADADGDGYGDPAVGEPSCWQPSGYVADDTDCDDGLAAVNPGAIEICDGVDQDCDGDIDEGTTSVFYADADGDGYGDATATTEACEVPGGYSEDATDCDDGDAAVNPGADEVCDGVDDDCDGSVDEAGAVDAPTWYADADGDGWGDDGAATAACEAPSGTVADPGDCDDTDPAVFPGAEEICDGVDQDCDGDIDEDAADAATWYLDADGDGYGDPATAATGCAPPTGYVADGTDCDDGSAFVNPGAEEICDGADQDCDGAIDEDATDVVTWYADADGDGWGDDAVTAAACEAPSGHVAWGGDCDDSDPAFNPGASETDCTDPNDYNCDGVTGYADSDGDGFAACEECDDSDAAVYPGADERCNGRDDDCDGEVDEGDAVDGATWYADADGDGWGDAGSTTTACSRPAGYVADSSDCDDGDAGVFPGAAEHCNGVDDDCDGFVDLGAIDAPTWYADDDGDGYGDVGDTASGCSAPAGYVADATDCDDGDAAINPGATEVCNGVDDDCSGRVDEPTAADAPTWYADADGDGYGDAASSTRACSQPTGYLADDSDCDDGDRTVHPGATETCDGEDEDCDGSIDEGATDAVTWYVDDDGDGFGDAASTTRACSAPAGYVADATDCDDGDAAVNPAATEVCNGVDDDCSGGVDEPSAADALTWYADDDGDGYGDAGSTARGCSAPAGYLADDSDCDDSDASVHPGATETCDGVDEDCDGGIDEGAVDALTWYADADGDGYGDAGSTTRACSQPSGYLADATDCDDGDAAINPAATEVCNGVDDDCSGGVDEPSAADAATWYADADRDGYGNLASTTRACTQPSGYVASSTDCDDAQASVHPGAAEVCDGIDQDCDGTADDGAVDAATWYADADGDGYGNAGSTTRACSLPTGYVADATDCDDGVAAVNPGATEVCNGVDDDCSGGVDEPSAADAATWYADADSDGYGDASATTRACSEPAGYGLDATDCDDGDASVHPGATETCDGDDEDCDGSVDEGAVDAATWYADADGDGYGNAASSTRACSAPTGYVAGSTDCDDTDAGVHPGASEYCDGEDDDCDGTIDESAVDATTWYRDADGDGYGNAASTQRACTVPSGYVAGSTDCDDTLAAVHPGATETCNGYDDDCDGLVDDDDTGVTGRSTWYQDYDLDGYGDAAVSTQACDEPSGYTDDDADCDDGDPDVNPGASEACNGIDDDCDGSYDEGSVCPCAVETYGSHPYMFCNSVATWTIAQSTCWSYDYHLVSIADAAEDVWVNATADTYSTLKWWMGFNDRASEGTWVWEDGSPVTYTNWYAGEPNDVAWNEDCGQFNRFHPDNGWNDEPCTSAFRFICEAD